MKPGAFTQIYIHVVFGTKRRQNLLSKEIREEVFPYLSAILNNLEHRAIIVNGVSDHVHILFWQNPKLSISETIRNIKKSSSKFINLKFKPENKFNWQNGYGAFSVHKRGVKNVIQYIHNQENHHMEKSFKDEYIRLLKENKVNYDERYLLPW